MPRRAQNSATTKPQSRKRAFALAALTFVIAGPLTVVVLDWGMNKASADGAPLEGLSSPAMASQSAPTAEGGRWLVHASTDPIDDTKTVKISLAADGTGRETVRPALVARCQSGRTDVYVAWDTYVGTDPDFPESPYRDVTVRIGELRSCPSAWCNWGRASTHIRLGRVGQRAGTAGKLTRGSSLKGATDSSDMYLAR